MIDVDEDTCEYGLVQTSRGCVTTLSSLRPNPYVAMQIIYCVAGFVALSASSYKFSCAVRFQGARLQKQIFLLCMYASLTILLRGIDPSSYAHYTPRPLSSFLTDSCTATLHTILYVHMSLRTQLAGFLSVGTDMFIAVPGLCALVLISIKSLSFYISITQHGVVKKRKSLVLFERTAIFIIWGFYVTCDVSSISDKGFGGISTPVQLFVSAGFLFFVSTSFVVFGAQVIKRLESIETMATQQMMFASDSCRSIDYSSEEAHAVLEEVKSRPLKPADRIRKVLIVTESVSLLSVVALVYLGVLRQNSRIYELDCANGFNCDKIHAQVNPLHICQYIWIWVALWSYRRTQKREATKRRRGTEEV